MKKRLKINGVVMFLATLFLAGFPALFFRENTPGPADIISEVFGITLVLLGQLVRISARGFKSAHSQSGIALVRGGPYALVRNPMYLGIFLIGLGIVLMLFQWWVVAIFVIFFVIRYLLLIFQEEKKLKSLFAEDYAVYCRDVPRRIFPAAAALLEEDVSKYIPLRPEWVKREIGSVLAVLFLALFLESWEEIRHNGLAAYCKEAAGIFAVIILFICLAGYLSWRTNAQNGADK